MFDSVTIFALRNPAVLPMSVNLQLSNEGPALAAPIPAFAESDVVMPLLANASANQEIGSSALAPPPLCKTCNVKPAKFFCFLCAEKSNQLCDGDCARLHDHFCENHKLRPIEDRKFQEGLKQAMTVFTKKPCAQLSKESREGCRYCHACRSYPVTALPAHSLMLKKDSTLGSQALFADHINETESVHQTVKTIFDGHEQICTKLAKLPSPRAMRMAVLDVGESIDRLIQARDIDAERDQTLAKMAEQRKVLWRLDQEANHAAEVAKFMQSGDCASIEMERVISIGLRSYISSVKSQVGHCAQDSPTVEPLPELDEGLVECVMKKMRELQRLNYSFQRITCQQRTVTVSSSGAAGAAGSSGNGSGGNAKRNAATSATVGTTPTSSSSVYIYNVVDNGSKLCERRQAAFIADLERNAWLEANPGDNLCWFVRPVGHTPGRYLPVDSARMNIKLKINFLNFMQALRNIDGVVGWNGSEMDLLLELFDIDHNDRRTELRGQKGVRAKKRIKQFTILGPYTGVALKPGSLDGKVKSRDLRAELDHLQSMDPNVQPLHIHRYAFKQPLEKPASEFLCGIDVPENLLISALDRGNILSMVNAVEPEQFESRNVGVEALRMGCQGPILVYYARLPIAKGEELLMDYGDDFIFNKKDEEWFSSSLEDPAKMHVSDRFEREQTWKLKPSCCGQVTPNGETSAKRKKSNNSANDGKKA